MPKRLPFSQYLVVALLAGAVATPAAITAFISNYEDHLMDGEAMDIRLNAIQNRASQRAQRRLYEDALEIYERLLQQGEDVEKPDLNDRASIDALINWEPERSQEAAHEAAPLPSSAFTSELSPTQERIITRYTRAHMCPKESLDRLGISGAYELCLSLVGEDASPTFRTGFINDNVKLHSANAVPTPSFKLRMQMIQEAFDRSNRRESTNRHSVPTPFTQEPVQGWENYPQ